MYPVAIFPSHANFRPRDNKARIKRYYYSYLMICDNSKRFYLYDTF